MFDRLRGKRNSASASATPKELVFKSNQAAFEYACTYLDNSTDGEKPTLAMVFSTHGNFASLKLANADDNSIPTQHPREIEDLSNICLAAEKLDGVPPLKSGDLVMFVISKELATLGSGCAVGFVLAKVAPTFSLQRGGWKVATY